MTEDGAHIAFQVLGEGPPDLLVIMSSAFPVEDQMEGRECSRFLRRLASFSRVIRLDRRGIGMSDPVQSFDEHVYERWVDDALAVLDTVGSTEVAALATDQAACSPALLLAATHPDRASRLVLHQPTARLLQAPDYPLGIAESEVRRVLDNYVESLVSGSRVETVAFHEPALEGNEEFHEWFLRARRRGLPPKTAKAIYTNWLYTDLRSVLTTISVPTLIFTRPEATETYAMVGYVAERIDDCRLVELDGQYSFLFLEDIDRVVGEIEHFLTGTKGLRSTERVLATVLFTDIVGSTEHATELGDRRWRDLLDSHDETVRRQLERFRGREVNTVGDGFLATFDGPGRAILCACAIRDAVRALGLEVRAGLHTGEVELRGEDVAGVAVHIGARVAASAGAGEVLVSGAVPPLVAGSGICFEDRGERELKGIPDTWRLYAVEGT